MVLAFRDYLEGGIRGVRLLDSQINRLELDAVPKEILLDVDKKNCLIKHNCFTP